MLRLGDETRILTRFNAALGFCDRDGRITNRADIRKRYCADYSAQLPGLPPARRSRADVATELQRRPAVGEVDQGKGPVARDAAVVRDSRTWPILQRLASLAKGYRDAGRS